MLHVARHAAQDRLARPSAQRSREPRCCRAVHCELVLCRQSVHGGNARLGGLAVNPRRQDGGGQGWGQCGDALIVVVVVCPLLCPEDVHADDAPPEATTAAQTARWLELEPWRVVMRPEAGSL